MLFQKSDLIKELENLVQIKEIDGKEVVAFCPLHGDNHPSFFFNLDTQLFQCFAGCCKGRGLHQLKFLLTGIRQDGNLVSQHRMKKKTLKTPSIPALPLALDNEGERYLASRGFVEDTIREWSLLYWKRENAIVIPIHGVGYILRYLSPKDGKKYKYVPGTRIETILFGIEKFKSIDNSAILVEGAFDSIWLWQLGYTNSLAILHSNISHIQINLLKGLTVIIYLMLDGDKTGREMTDKIGRVLRRDFIVKKCQLPENKDPNDCSEEEIIKVLKGVNGSA